MRAVGHGSLIGAVLLTLAAGAWAPRAGALPRQGGAQGAGQSRLPLEPCRVGGMKEEILCGTHEVYENREARKGRRIPLNVMVIPALSPRPAPDPLFVLVGGPGQAATDGAEAFSQLFAEVRQNRDIVLVDQRGTGRSNRLDCTLASVNDAIQAFVAYDIPRDQIRRCRAELERKADLRFYTTPVAMDDLDEVRAWLGYEKINVYGGSYGTRAALVYLSRHPERVRTLTLRAVFSLNLLYSPRDAQAALDRLFDDCAKDAACSRAYPNLRADFQTVLERLAKSPARITVKDPRTNQPAEVVITRDAFAGGVRRLLYDTGAQRSIPYFITRALAGDFKPYESVVGPTLGLLGALSLGMNLSVTCPEGMSRVKPSDVERATRGTFLGAHMANGIIGACREWARPPLPKSYFEPVRSDVPALIFSGVLDPQTPPVWGAEVARHLPNSRHVVMEGIAHGPFPPCAVKLMARFVETADAKSLDTACVSELRRPPFIVPQAAK